MHGAECEEKVMSVISSLEFNYINISSGILLAEYRAIGR